MRDFCDISGGSSTQDERMAVFEWLGEGRRGGTVFHDGSKERDSHDLMVSNYEGIRRILKGRLRDFTR